MNRYTVEIWAGSGEQRWNTQSVTTMAESFEDAKRTVAEGLGLAPAHWQGIDPPLELVPPSTYPVTGPPVEPAGWLLASLRGHERRDVATRATEVAPEHIELVG